MKNIHIMPTDKPSRLFLNKINYKLLLEDISNPSLKDVLPSGSYQNIYITSTEEIKKGDYMLDVSEMTISLCIGLGVSGYKIILTTDQSLIKNGVQHIDDEFLQWFVKNPSCEKVEVIKQELNTDYRSNWKQKFYYKIIIP